MKKRSKSIQLQSFVAMFIIGILPITILTVLFVGLYRSRSVSRFVNELQVRGNVISNLIINSQYFQLDHENLEEATDTEVDREVDRIAESYHGRILLVNEKLQVVRDSFRLEDGETVILPDVLKLYRAKNPSVKVVEHRENVEVYMPITRQDENSLYGVVVMQFSFLNLKETYQNIAQTAFVMWGLMSVLLVLAMAIINSRLHMPIQKLKESVKNLAVGNTTGRVYGEGNQEVEEIAGDINEMISRSHNLEESQNEFVSSVSHELKTPIASMKILAESLTMQEEGVPIELYQEFMKDINKELVRMDNIVEELLSLVKLDSEALDMKVEDTGINELIEEILKVVHPIAEKRSIDLIYESARIVRAQVDQVKLQMAITNVIENAIKYNNDHGWVKVTLNADHQYFYLRVSDNGVGIPEDLVDHIFERFYRVDKARSRETGGNGLGLSITRRIILLHRGDIKVQSAEKEGTTFAIRIPLNYQELGPEWRES